MDSSFSLHSKNSPSGSFYTIHDFTISLLLCLATIAVYWQTRYFDFLNFDDQLFIFKFANLKAGLTFDNIIWAFTSPTLETNYWIPLTWLSFLLDYEIFGHTPGGYHTINFLLHAANSVLLFILLKTITSCRWKSAFVAALFALHPLHVESVAWITERKDVLSTFFFLLTLSAYYRYAKTKTGMRYLICLVIFCFGLMAKPMLVTLPFVLILIDLWPLGRTSQPIFPVTTGLPHISFSKLILEKIPFFLVILVIGSITYWFQMKAGNVGSLESYPLSLRASNALVSYVVYIRRMFLPLDLAALYPYPEYIPWWQAAGSALMLLGFTFFAIKKIPAKPYIFVGWSWYLITLLPVIGFIKVGPQALADRYTYIPLIGPFITVTWWAFDIFSRKKLQMWLIYIACGIIGLLSIITWKQVSYWENTITIFKHTLAATSENPYAHAGLGTGYLKKGKLDDAIFHLSRALEVKPDYILALKNMGIALEEKGEIDKAIEYYLKVIKMYPSHADAYNDLGVALQKQGKLEAAAHNFFKAVELSPDNLKAHNNLASLLAQQGRLEEAIYHYTESLRIDPLLSQTYNELGVLFGKLGRLDSSIDNFLEALELEPQSAILHNNIGAAYANQANFTKAHYHFKQAVLLDQGNRIFSENLNRVELILKNSQ